MITWYISWLSLFSEDIFWSDFSDHWFSLGENLVHSAQYCLYQVTTVVQRFNFCHSYTRIVMYNKFCKTSRSYITTSARNFSFQYVILGNQISDYWSIVLRLPFLYFEIAGILFIPTFPWPKILSPEAYYNDLFCSNCSNMHIPSYLGLYIA